MRPLLQAKDFSRVIGDLATRIAATQNNFNDVAFVGIHTRGIPLASRLVQHFHKQGRNVLEGMLDINLYRDDLSESASHPVLKETKIEFDINNKVVYLVDDVLYTGRTIRAAMDAIFDLGRPKAVHLVVMARRNGRELPIDTHLVGIDVDTKATDNVKVKFVETDGKDDVSVLEEGEY